jgi:shikimate dehydrogenase
MEKTEKKEKRYGLLGKNISYSFSQGYFTQKFKDLGLNDHSYENFDLQEITELERVLSQNQLKGLNVTIPYKEEVIPYLDEMDA